MIFDGKYYAGGHLRWNLGWPTPNYGGAFVVTLVVLLWGLSASRWRWSAFSAEACGLFLMTKSYSRGALVAWGIAWLFGFFASRGWKSPRQRFIWAARVGVLSAMLLVTGFSWSRAAPNLAEASASDSARLPRASGKKSVDALNDGSVVNRLELWRGGLRMITAAPLAGWGAGESGRAYMNWYQDVDRREAYATMVNGYLQVGVEHGLIALGLVFVGMEWLLVAAWQGAHDDTESSADAIRDGESVTKRATLYTGAGSSLVAWAVVNIFTTMWMEPMLWVVPLLAAGLLAYAMAEQPHRFIQRGLLNAVGTSSLAVVGLYSVGVLLDQGHTLRIRLDGSTADWQCVEVSRKQSDSMAPVVKWRIWPDRRVLGPYPGKELRRWVRAESTAMAIKVETGWNRNTPTQGGRMLLFGQQASRLSALDLMKNDRIYVVHPFGAPPATFIKCSGKHPMLSVLLPEIDEEGNSPAWRKWAAAHGATTVITLGTGTDIRSVWPEVAKTLRAN